MKSIPIKFRGISLMTGRMLFGDLIHNSKGNPELCYLNGNTVKAAEIVPESVAQLVGYDADGNEVYEGDTLVSAGGVDFTAELWAMGVNDLDADDIGGVFKFTLKGGDEK